MTTQNSRESSEFNSKATWNEYSQMIAHYGKDNEKIHHFEREILQPLSLKAIKASLQEIPSLKETVRAMLVPVGFTPIPLANNILALEPEYVAFITSKESYDTIDHILDITKLGARQHQKFEAPADDLTKLYGAFRQALIWLHERETPPIPFKHIAIDVTGGTKIMPFAAAIVAQNFNLTMIYTNAHEYDRSLRRPVAGTEYLVVARNIKSTFQDQSFLQALQFMENLHFHSALDLIDDMLQSPQFLSHRVVNLSWYLCKGLSAWDGYEYHEARQTFEEALAFLDNNFAQTAPLDEFLSRSIRFLRIVIDDALLRALDMYLKGQRQLHRHAYNEAVITTYGAVEMATRAVLEVLGIDKDNFTDETFNPTIIFDKFANALGPDKQAVKTHEGLLEHVDQVFNHQGARHFINSNKLGVVQGLGILAALDIIPPGKARRFRNLATLRNNLIHRADTIPSEKAEDFMVESLELLLNIVSKMGSRDDLQIPVFIPPHEETQRNFVRGQQKVAGISFFFPLQDIINWLQRHFFKEHVLL